MSRAERRPRVAFLVDRPGGPAERRARALAEHLASRFDVRLARGAGELDPRALDLLYVFAGAEQDVASLRLPPQRVVRELARADADAAGAGCLTATSRAVFAALQARGARSFLLPQGVDLRRFQASARRGARLRVGWLGDPGDPAHGLRDVIAPACADLFELELCDARRGERARARFYARIDVIALAAPEAEQEPWLLEAMASGCFPVATDGALLRELCADGVNARVAARTPEAFRDALAACAADVAATRRAGRLCAELVAEERDAEPLAERTGDVLDALLSRAPAPPAVAPSPPRAARAALARGVVPLRVAFVTPEFPDGASASGGLGSYLQRICAALQEAGHRPEVFCLGAADAKPARRGEPPRHCALPAAERPFVHRIERALHHLGLSALRPALEAAVDAFALAWLLRRQARRAGFDLVQGSDHRASSLFLRALVRGPVHLLRLSHDDRHAARLNGADPRPRVAIDWLYGLALRRAPLRYAPSEFLARHAQETRGLRVAVVRPPARLECKPAEPRRPLPERYFLFAGKLVPMKGAAVLAAALRRVLVEEPRFHMVFAGPDPLRAFAGFTAGWGLHARRVRHLGELRRDELYGVLARAEAAVFPSLFDNLPNGVVEALLLGVPVIGSAGASIDELVEPGVTGVLVPPGDAGALATALLAQWRGQTRVGRGFTWQVPEALRPEVAVARLLELAGLAPASASAPAETP
jgi:glycosyltransferase involved in cell wall biosynthesis